MTAYRVVDDHEELQNVGSLTHARIDDYINDTGFIVYSGSVELPSGSRQLVAGGGILITDGGPGSTITISSTTSGAFVYPDDLTVTLKGGKTFGKYSSGEKIPSTGKTPAEVIMMAISEPIDPTTYLSGSSPMTSTFNITGSVITSLTASHVINGSGAVVASALLEHRTGGVGSWSTLSTDISSPLLFDHTFVADPFFTSSLDYRYTVTDDQGASSATTISLVPQGYLSPTISLSVVRSSPGIVIGETDAKREIGNVGSYLSGVITRRRDRVAITSYSVQFSTNGSSWSDVPGLSSVPVTGNPSSVSIPATLHFDASLKNKTSLYYRVRVVDEYQTTTSSTSTINFLKTIFYGPAPSTPVTSFDVRSLPSVRFTDASNPFNLETGNVERRFAVAIPHPQVVTEVLDLDALNANITANYSMSTVSVEDGGGNFSDYHVYTMTNAIPYTSNHRHRVTRG